MLVHIGGNLYEQYRSSLRISWKIFNSVSIILILGSFHCHAWFIYVALYSEAIKYRFLGNFLYHLFFPVQMIFVFLEELSDGYM